MVNDQLGILSKVAMGSAPQEQVSVPDLMVNKVADDLAMFSLESRDLDPIETMNAFKHLELPMNNYTKTMIHEAGAKIHPHGKAAYYTEVEENIEFSIAAAVDDEQRESILRDLLPSVPEQSMKKMSHYFLATQDKLNAKALHKARAGQVIEFQNFLDKFRFASLDINKSLEAHASDAVKGYTTGFGDSVEVQGGSFVIPTESGEYQSVYALADVEDLQDRFTSEVDLKPIARKLFTQTLAKEQERHTKRETQITSKMYESLERFPSDIQTNIILDRAYNSPKESKKLALEGITKQTRREIHRKTTGTRAIEIAHTLSKYADRLELAMSERMSDGRI